MLTISVFVFAFYESKILINNSDGNSGTLRGSMEVADRYLATKYSKNDKMILIPPIFSFITRFFHYSNFHLCISCNTIEIKKKEITEESGNKKDSFLFHFLFYDFLISFSK